ncbi:MAG: tetratricopeptide repeat protein [Candidatus Thorarchaeota archaeon]
MGEIVLKVAKAEHRDIGRFIVRFDDQSMKEMGVRTGDIIQIKGKHLTTAIAWPAYQGDTGHEIIRMDGRIRRNAGVSLSEKVTVSRANDKPAKIVTLANTSVPIRPEPRFEEFVKKKLLNCPVTLQDTVFIPILGRAIPFKVTSIKPAGTVVVKHSTKLTIEEVSGDGTRHHLIFSYNMSGIANVDVKYMHWESALVNLIEGIKIAMSGSDDTSPENAKRVFEYCNKASTIITQDTFLIGYGKLKYLEGFSKLVLNKSEYEENRQSEVIAALSESISLLPPTVDFLMYCAANFELGNAYILSWSRSSKVEYLILAIDAYKQACEHLNSEYLEEFSEQILPEKNQTRYHHKLVYACKTLVDHSDNSEYSERLVVTLKELIEKDKENALLHVVLGYVHQKSNAIDEAIIAYSEAYKFEPHNEQFALQIVRMLLVRNEWSEALNLLREIESENPGDISVHTLIVESLLGLKEFESAIDHCKNLLKEKENSKNPTLWYLLGTAYIELQQHKDAIKSLLKSINLKEDNPETWLLLGRTYEHLGQHDKAKKALVRAQGLSKEP